MKLTKLPTDWKPTDFEDFWKAYPRRVGKLAAKRKYQQALKHATHDEIMAGVAAFARAEPWNGNLLFCPHPATWLHQGRWEDEHEHSLDKMRKDFLHGDERDDLGLGAVNGRCVEVSGRGLETDGVVLLHGPAGLERRGHRPGNGGPAGKLDEADGADTGGNTGNRERIAALTAKAAKACKT